MHGWIYNGGGGGLKNPVTRGWKKDYSFCSHWGSSYERESSLFQFFFCGRRSHIVPINVNIKVVVGEKESFRFLSLGKNICSTLLKAACLFWQWYTFIDEMKCLLYLSCQFFHFLMVRQIVVLWKSYFHLYYNPQIKRFIKQR